MRGVFVDGWCTKITRSAPYSTPEGDFGAMTVIEQQMSQILEPTLKCAVRVRIWAASFPKANDKWLSNQHLSMRAFFFSGNISPLRNLSLLFFGWSNAARPGETFFEMFVILQLGNGTVTAWLSLSEDHFVRHKTCFRLSPHKQQNLGPIRWEGVCQPLWFCCYFSRWLAGSFASCVHMNEAPLVSRFVIRDMTVRHTRLHYFSH